MKQYTWKNFIHFVLNKEFNVPLFTIATLLSILDTILSVVISIRLKELIDNFTSTTLTNIVYYVVTILIIKALLDSASTYILNFIGLNVINFSRNQASGTLTYLKKSAVSNEQSGELASHVINDTLALFDFVSRDISDGIVSFVSTIIYISFLLYLNVKLTLLIILLTVPILLVYIMMGGILSKITFINQKLNAQFTHILTDTIKKLILIQSQNFQQNTLNHLESFTDKIKHNSYRKLFVSTGFKFVANVLTIIGMVVLVFYSQSQLRAGHISFGIISAYILTTIQLVPAILSIGGFLATLNQAKGASSRLYDIVHLPVENIHEGSKIKQINKIEFKNVALKYGDKLVLDDLSFTINPGDTVSIEGKNGSGKTTLLMLIMGFLRPTSGQIFINDTDINLISKQSLRSQISYANQEPLIMEGSVSENITIGQDDGSQNIVNDLIKKYSINQEKLIEDGNNLSGGQKQKISIARLELQNKSTIILDETFSNLDSNSKKDLSNLIDQMRHNSIVILVDHDNTMNYSITKRIKMSSTGEL